MSRDPADPIDQIDVGNDDHVRILIAAIRSLVDAKQHDVDVSQAAPEFGACRIFGSNADSDNVLDHAAAGGVVLRR